MVEQHFSSSPGLPKRLLDSTSPWLIRPSKVKTGQDDRVAGSGGISLQGSIRQPTQLSSRILYLIKTIHLDTTKAQGHSQGPH